jgi:MFS family permease
VPTKLSTNRTFIVFASARTVSWLGSAITSVVLPVLVYSTTNSPTAVAWLSVFRALPYVAFGFLAGALADRMDRLKTMVVCDCAAALLLASVPTLALLHHLLLAQMLLVALGAGVAFVWFDAADFGTVPAIVERTQLPVASSFLSSSSGAAYVIGPTVGGVLLGVMAPAYAVGFDAASYVASAILLISIRRQLRRPRVTGERHRSLRGDIAEGLRFLWHQPVIRTLTLAVCCGSVSWGGSVALLVVYARHALHMTHPDARLGLLYSAGAAGGLISAAAVPALIKRLQIGRLMAIFMAANVGALLAMAIAPTYILALVAFFGYELVFVVTTMTGVTVRRMLTPDHLQGRVNTVGRVIAYGSQPVGALLSGFVAELLPIRATFGLLAIGAVVGTALIGWACRGQGIVLEASEPATAASP